jgi:hypothetical protein
MPLDNSPKSPQSSPQDRRRALHPDGCAMVDSYDALPANPPPGCKRVTISYGQFTHIRDLTPYQLDKVLWYARFSRPPEAMA